MASNDKDKSISETVSRRPRRGSELQRLAEEKGMAAASGQADEVLQGLAGDAELPAEELEMNQLESTREPQLPEKSIDEQLLANLGKGKNDYGVAEDLIPQIDFDTIPLTQPKRVMSKTRSGQSAERDLPEGDTGTSEETPSRAPKRKKKSPSLLDSYFKGL